MSGRSANVVVTVVSLIVLTFVLSIGLILNAETDAIMNTMDMGESGNSTRTSLQSNVATGYNLMALTPLIISGAALLGILIVGFTFYTRGR